MVVKDNKIDNIKSNNVKKCGLEFLSEKMSSTNELPLSFLKLKSNMLSPEIALGKKFNDDMFILFKDSQLKISPIATNERPISCECLFTNIQTADSDDSITEFTQGESENELYVSSFTSESETSNYFSTYEDIDPFRYKYPLSNRSLSYTFSMNSKRDNIIIPFQGYCYNCYKADLYQSLPIIHLGQNLASTENENLIDDDKTKFKDTENVKNRLCSLSNSIDESTYKDDIPSSESTFSFIITPTTINETNCGLKNTNENSSTLCFKSNIIDPNKLHPQIFKMHNSEHHTPSSTNTSNIRRQRHSISGQMSYFNKVFGFGSFKKMATSTNSLFSTAVISGSSSAPNLRDMIPSTASPSGKFMKKRLSDHYFNKYGFRRIWWRSSNQTIGNLT